jgi:hypothetical protein
MLRAAGLTVMRERLKIGAHDTPGVFLDRDPGEFGGIGLVGTEYFFEAFDGEWQARHAPVPEHIYHGINWIGDRHVDAFDWVDRDPLGQTARREPDEPHGRLGVAGGAVGAGDRDPDLGRHCVRQIVEGEG